MIKHFAQFGFLALALTVFSGCESKTAMPTANDASASDAHAGHDHGDEGPHGGHLLHLDPGGVHAEWTHDDEAKSVTVYLDDLDGAKIKSVKFDVKIGDAAPQEFPLTKAEQGWTLASEELTTHLNMGEAANVSLVVDTEDGAMSTKIEHHEHHHH